VFSRTHAELQRSGITEEEKQRRSGITEEEKQRRSGITEEEKQRSPEKREL
jgi:hypothetical protein